MSLGKDTDKIVWELLLRQRKDLSLSDCTRMGSAATKFCILHSMMGHLGIRGTNIKMLLCATCDADDIVSAKYQVDC